MNTQLNAMPATPTPDDFLTLRVLVIEHRPAVAAALSEMLRRAGMCSAWAATGPQAVALHRSFVPHVALVDFDLPAGDAGHLIRLLARAGGCGIIGLTDGADAADRSLALEIGADDFMAKSTGSRELLARIRAVHRRVYAPEDAAEPTGAGVSFGSNRVDFCQRRMTDAAGRPIDITGAEFAVLETLVEARGATVSRGQLSEIVLRRPWRAEDRSIDQLIFGLRRKIPTAGTIGSPIHSIRGVGYMIPLMAGA